MRRTIKATAAGAALVVLAVVSSMGARVPQQEHFDEFGTFYRGGADSVDTARVYFAATGTTTVNDSLSVGYLTYLDVEVLSNSDAVDVIFRAYHPGGVTNPGTDSAYTDIILNGTLALSQHTAGRWTMPEGMRVNSIQVTSNAKGAGTSLWRWGK